MYTDKIVYRDFDSLFEKFAILTVDGRMTDPEAVKFLQNKTDCKLLEQLKNKVHL